MNAIMKDAPLRQRVLLTSEYPRHRGNSLRAALHDANNKLTAISLVFSGGESEIDPVSLGAVRLITENIRSNLQRLLEMSKNEGIERVQVSDLTLLRNRLKIVLPYLERLDIVDGDELKGIVRTSIDEFAEVMETGIKCIQMSPDCSPPTSHDISEFVLDIVNRFKKERPNTIFEVSVEPQCEATFRAAGIRRSLENLILNAIQAMPETGGRITICLKRTQYDVTTRPFEDISAGTYVTIEIEGNGSGIPSEVIQRLPYSMITTKKNGSGVGLASACEQLKRDNGHLILEGGDDRGARAIALIPSIPPPPKSNPGHKQS